MSTEVISNNEDNITKKTKYKWKICWSNTILLAVLHVAAVYGFFLKSNLKWQSVVFFKVYGIVSNLGITTGAHRLWAHRSYKANTFVQILLVCMASMTYQNSIYVWARDHRVHHKFSETDADPHNSKRGLFFSHMGWLMLKKHPDVIEKGRTVDLSDLEANPVVMFQHKYYYQTVALFTFLFSIFLPMYFFGETFQHALWTVTIYRYIVTVNLTWCINSITHAYGNKPYDKDIGPVQNKLMQYLANGEGFHNYHHTFPHDYKAAELGNDVRNLTTTLIDTFAWFGWVTDRQTASNEVIKNKVERSGDGTHGKVFTWDHKNNFINVIIYSCMIYIW